MRNGSYLEMSFLEKLQQQSVAVVGAGVTGVATTKFLLSNGIKPVVFDESSKEIEGVATVAFPAQNIDLAIISPGWNKSHPIIEALSRSGAELISEIDFAWRIKQDIAPAQKWIALTGTNGKTTSVQMVASIFKSAGVHGTACGNVGETVIESLTRTDHYDFLAIELSSFQIDWSHEARFEACAILNIAEDHIDWHGSFDHYANSKIRLLSFSQIAILNAEDVEVVNRSTSWNGKKVFYSLQTPAVGELGLVEEILVDRAFVKDESRAEALAELTDIKPTVPHNVSNALAAAGLARAVGIDYPAIKAGLQAFVLDHHRIEVVLEKDGISWVNDSKATNPHSAIASILSHEKVLWIAGGLAKGANMDTLVKRVTPRLVGAILIGRDHNVIAEALKKFAPSVPITIINDYNSPMELMDAVITQAMNNAQSGETVLLAPACASMDQFTSYAHRGDLFASSVHKLVGA